jgi:hypothetical protein
MENGIVRNIKKKRDLLRALLTETEICPLL